MGVAVEGWARFVALRCQFVLAVEVMHGRRPPRGVARGDVAVAQEFGAILDAPFPV